MSPAHGARLLNTHASVPLFVQPQPIQYTPYGTRVSIPRIGTPTAIEIPDHPLLHCDLVDGVISQTIFVVNEDGDPVAGARVEFTVSRSDIEAPQYVHDITGFDGAATVTVKVPTPTAGSPIAHYSVLADAFGVDPAAPNASVRFAINDYTCTGVAGVR